MTLKTKNIGLIALAIATSAVLAQNPRSQASAPTDSAAQASPIAPVPKVAATDSAAEASPTAPLPASGATVRAHTALHVTLAEDIDSGSLKNGQTIRARLSNDVPLSSGAGKGRRISAGSPALLTVVGTVPAGKINAVGELSLQLVQIGNQQVDTEVLTFRGRPGKKEIADAAPELGTNAGLKSGAPLTFHTQPSPTMEAERPTHGEGPGAVSGVAPGAMPVQNSSPNDQGSHPGPNQPASHKQTATPQR